jgi:hypothetical protein
MRVRWLVQLAAVCLASCSAACQAAATLSPTAADTPTPSATATATRVWFPPTTTPTPTLTPAPATATPGAPSGLGAVLLSDDFSSRKLWTTGAMEGGNIAYGTHELSLAVAIPKGSLISLREQASFSDFYLEIRAAPSLCLGRDQYGVLFRAASPNDFYRLMVSCDGFVRLERLVNGNGTLLHDWTPSLQINPGVPGAYRLGIWAKGSELRVYINNAFQFSRQDAALAQGGIGVFTRAAGDNAVTVTFSDLVIRAISQ